MLRLAEERGYSSYFLGGDDECITDLMAQLTATHARLRIAGWRNGYWDKAEDSYVVAAIRQASPDILFVGLPWAFKDEWLADNLEALGVPFSLGVGGCFDLFAGRVKRAPMWAQAAGLEWFYRLAHEPRRLWRRYLFGECVLRYARRPAGRCSSSAYHTTGRTRGGEGVPAPAPIHDASGSARWEARLKTEGADGGRVCRHGVTLLE